MVMLNGNMWYNIGYSKMRGNGGKCELNGTDKMEWNKIRF